MLLHSLPSHLLLAINVFRTQPLADRLPPVRKLLAIIAVRNRHTNFVPHVSTGAPEFFKEVFGGVKKESRGERIRTSDLSVPNRTRYQAALRPDKPNKL